MMEKIKQELKEEWDAAMSEEDIGSFHNAMFHILFSQPDDEMDQTEFTADADGPDEAYEELEEFFIDFCEGEGWDDENLKVTGIEYAGPDPFYGDDEA